MNKLAACFYGVRGSMATPGPETRGVGGNTSCVEVTCGDTRIVLDAGTGLSALGDRLAQHGPAQLTLLLSHLHWDHIQGLPFFTPLYIPGSRIEVMSGPCGSMSLREALNYQMRPPFFPVSLEDVAGQLSVRDLSATDRFRVGDVVVSVAKLNHPDPVYAYRLDANGSSVVFATDTEHYSCVDPTLRKLASGADVLIYDAQYTPEEYRGDEGPSRVGWGHSTFEAGAQLARAAGVRQLVLFHHDPRRSDAAVERIERRARQLFANTVAAREGMVLHAGEGAGGGAHTGDATASHAA